MVALAQTDEQLLQNIAANVNRLRGELTFSEIARRCSTRSWKCYPATIEKLESRRHMPSAALLARVAHVLGTTSDALLADPDGSPVRTTRRTLAKAS